MLLAPLAVPPSIEIVFHLAVEVKLISAVEPVHTSDEVEMLGLDWRSLAK